MPLFIDMLLAAVRARDPDQPEFHQAVGEVVHSLSPLLASRPELARDGVLDRLVEPDRTLQFRVAWVDDAGAVRVNRGYRVQMNGAIGPYKGGLRFHPTVNLGVLKFLAFEQVFKNALTTLPMGGGKGGSDFDPKGRSEGEIMRFCQAFMTELHRYIGPVTDVPAGDIGVGSREIGYLFGQYRRLTNRFDGALTGKGYTFGGSQLRPEATGYGLVYFCMEMLKAEGASIEGRRVLISGSGNVALHAAGKCLELGARVLSLSDSGGTLHLPDGLTAGQLVEVKHLKFEERGRLRAYAQARGLAFADGQAPWVLAGDMALPCATQNELGAEDAAALIRNGCKLVAEGANMPCTPAAVAAWRQAGVRFAPGKAANAGGVATSGLEMSQNATHLSWDRGQVDQRLHAIMQAIHQSCVRHGRQEDGTVDYAAGANIAAFLKVAEAMRAQGVW